MTMTVIGLVAVCVGLLLFGVSSKASHKRPVSALPMLEKPAKKRLSSLQWLGVTLAVIGAVLYGTGMIAAAV